MYGGKSVVETDGAFVWWCLAHDGSLVTTYHVEKLFVVSLKKAVRNVVESFNT